MSTIDIIIPAYNCDKVISKCLTSIVKQSFHDYNVFIINDGSNDNTKLVIESFIKQLADKLKNKFIIINQDNKGSNNARNRGVELGVSPYILFCDADIQLNSNFLLLTKDYLDKNPGKSYCYTSFKYGWKTFRLWPFNEEKLKTIPYIHTTSLMRRIHFPGFDENIKRLQDWDLWLTMFEQGHTGIWLPKNLFKVNTRQGKISGWLPRFLYKIPWQKIGLKFSAIDKYDKAVKIIKEKHGLP